MTKTTEFFDAPDRVFEYDDIVDHLRSNLARVIFTKSDGSTRVMHCTLIKEYLPEQKDVEEYTANINKSAIPVWDVEHRGWRSFRIDSVKSIDYYSKLEEEDVNKIGTNI
jgi:hypothetical protein